jgi:predicted DCC family thiol-disulfide oxidoreductase YuxK
MAGRENTVRLPRLDDPHQRVWVVQQPTQPWTKRTYLIDGDCGFCRAAMAKVHATFPGTFESMPYADANLDGLGLTDADCVAQGHFIKPADDHVIISSGSQSWAYVLLEQRWPFHLVGMLMRAPGFKWVADRTYTTVARNRHRLHRT